MSLYVDMAELNSVIDALANEVEDAARPSAQAGAQVLYDDVKRNVASLGRVTGNLDRGIYQVYSKDNSGPGRATYHVSWNAKKAPHGHLVEYGHLQAFRVFVGKDGKWHTDKKHKLAQPRQIAAHPFIRPAMSKFSAAMEAAKAELMRRLSGSSA